jgi:hypothetical protein
MGVVGMGPPHQTKCWLLRLSVREEKNLSISEGLFYVRTKGFSFRTNLLAYYSTRGLGYHMVFTFYNPCSELSRGCVVVVRTYTCSRLSCA